MNVQEVILEASSILGQDGEDVWTFTFGRPEHPVRTAEMDEMAQLYAKTISTPQALTDSERRRILLRPIAAIEAANVAEVTNGALTAEQLITKAANQPESLTFRECGLLNNSFHVFDSISENLNWREQVWYVPEEITRARYEAQHAIETEEGKMVCNVLDIIPARRKEWCAVENVRKRLLASKPPAWVHELQESEAA